MVQDFVKIFLQLWQAFVGAKARRIENYYSDLLAAEDSVQVENTDGDGLSENDTKVSTTCDEAVPEKWKGQIEKVVKCIDLGT